MTLTALCTLPNVSPAQVFQNSFGNSTILFLIFSFVLTYALQQTGVLKRIAIYFIDNKIAKKNIYCFMCLYFTAMMIIGSFMAPTVVFILFYSLAKEIFALLNLEKGDKVARNMMIGTGFIASISCAATPIAHTFPLMALGYYEASTGTAISYAEYMKYSLPIGIILFVITCLLMTFKIDNHYNLSNVKFDIGKWTKNEIISLLVFGWVVIEWVVVGIFPDKFPVLNGLTTSFPAMIGIIFLAALGILNVKEGFTKGVAWPAILLCSATLALGKYLTAEEFGVIPKVSEILTPYLDKINVLFLVILLTIILTNLISNIVTTTVSYNLIVPVLLATTGLCSPVLATIFIGIGASLAYALPSSIAHIALAGSSGYATNKDMLKYGTIMIVASIIIIGIGAIL